MAKKWTPTRVAAVAGGGVLGAALRWAVVDLARGHGLFPWPVLGVNVVGSLLLGVLLAEESSHPQARLVLHDVGAIGFCGGLTTFSTFAVEAADLLARGHPITATTYTAASIVGALISVVVGAAGLRRARALTLPVEEEP